MPAGSTYTPIATTTLGSAQTGYTFSSIPSTYTDLIVIVQAKNSTSDNTFLRFNGDTATNYSETWLRGTGSAANSGRDSSVSGIYIDIPASAANTFNGNLIIHIMNYANTTTYKTAINRANNADLGTGATVGLWRSTAAISSVTLITGSGQYQTGSTFTLYGIASA